jgi:hypothetical protein
MDALIAPGVEPFAIAALVMAGLVAVEILTSLVGLSLSEMMGKEIGFAPDYGDADHGVLAGIASFVNPAGVPVLVLIIVALAGFSAAGYALQAAAAAVAAPLPAAVAALVAFAAAVPLTRGASRAIARIIPRDETYAVGPDDLVGLVAEVTLGPVDQGAAGRLKVKDRHGNWHFPMARAAAGAVALPVGAEVLIVERENLVYRVIPVPEELKTSRP